MARSRFAIATLILASSASAQAQAPGFDVSAPATFEPSAYVAALAATTIAARPKGESIVGPQRDLSPMAGVGVVLHPELAIELDLGPTLVDGGYVGFAVLPGAVWQLHSTIYVAGRLLVTLDPVVAVAPLAGIGASHTFASGLTPFVELDLLATDERDVSAGLTIGLVVGL